jgi:hypothetical protein
MRWHNPIPDDHMGFPSDSHASLSLGSRTRLCLRKAAEENQSHAEPSIFQRKMKQLRYATHASLF